MRLSELSEYLRVRRERFARGLGQEVLTLGNEERIHLGGEEAEIEGLLVTWLATAPSIRAAASSGCNVILAHEGVFHRAGWCRMRGDLPLFTVNLERERLLQEHNIGVFQCHSPLDEFLITDCFAEELGLPPAAQRRWRLQNIHEIEPVSLDTLAARVMARLGLSCVRVVGASDRVIRRIALAYGGIGLSSNLGCWEDHRDLSPDVFIAGEMDEMAMHYVIESGLAAIETGHAVSEEPGLRRLCEDLRGAFPGVRIVFHPTEQPWHRLTC
jgi:putative NIF3 family GTP cyclohydrolase 1 type 2